MLQGLGFFCCEVEVYALLYLDLRGFFFSVVMEECCPICDSEEGV